MPRKSTLYEIKFEIDEPQFTQREVLGVIDLPATTVNTWIKRDLLEPFEFFRDFRDDDDRLNDDLSGQVRDPRLVRTFQVFQHDPAVRRARLYSIIDTLCLAGMKAVLDASVEIRFASQMPVLLCDYWSDSRLLGLGRHSSAADPIILYVDGGELINLLPQTPIGKESRQARIDNLLSAMRDAQLNSVTVIDWPSVEERVIEGLKKIVDVRGHRDWNQEKE